MNSSWRIIALTPEMTIGGVWRLKDNRKFYLGEHTSFGYISGFTVRQGVIRVKCGGTKVFGIPELTKFQFIPLNILS